MKQQNKAIFPGTFNPMHDGHINIIKRASKLFDVLYVVVSINIYKTHEEKIEEVYQNVFNQVSKLHLKNVFVEMNKGLSVDFAKQHNCKYIVRSTRDINDFDFEIAISQVYYYLDNNIETIFLIAEKDLKTMSSTSTRMLNDQLLSDKREK